MFHCWKPKVQPTKCQKYDQEHKKDAQSRRSPLKEIGHQNSPLSQEGSNSRSGYALLDCKRALGEDAIRKQKEQGIYGDLEQEVFCFKGLLEDTTWMQDNCSVHNSKYSTKWLAFYNTKTMRWPTQCLALNLIENL